MLLLFVIKYNIVRSLQIYSIAHDIFAKHVICYLFLSI